MPIGEEVRQKLGGNAILYHFLRHHRPPSFLNRNINAVLDANPTVQSRSGPEAVTSSDDVAPKGTTVRRENRSRIDEVVAKLRPNVPADAKNVSILKIQPKRLRRRRSISSKKAGKSAQSKPRNQSIKCRCELVVYQTARQDETETRSRKKVLKELFRTSELCTVLFQDNGTSAQILMDEPFLIRANKLYVLTEQNDPPKPTLAESYEAQLSLQAMNASSTPWPSLISQNLGGLVDDPLKANLVVSIKSLPKVPPSPWHPAELRNETDTTRVDIEIEVECGWSWPKTVAIRNTLPKPSRTVKGSSRAFTPSASPREDWSLSWVYKGSSFTVPRIECIFCNEVRFQDLTKLHFHLITAHEKFAYKVRTKKFDGPSRNRDSGESQNHADIHVELAKEISYIRASNGVLDWREFRWHKPAKHFDINRILKGDWSWLNEKKPVAGLGYRRGNSSDETPPPYRPSLENVPAIPIRKKKRYRVPHPNKRDGDDGLVFVRNKSKRYIVPGEELSDSDIEIDERWLKSRHEETIKDFEDVGESEKAFMKIWDEFIFQEKPIGRVHLAHTMIRFARRHADYIRRSPLLIEFHKHALYLIQMNYIDTLVFKQCMDVIKGGKNKWSSVGETKCGVGLVGPVPFDFDQAKIETPARPRRWALGSIGSSQQVPVKVEDGRKAQLTGCGICTCGGTFRKTDMMRCSGKECDIRWFHRSCYKVHERRPDLWLCPDCIET